ncbi:hypothetical protein Tco_1415060 [Tanacetum coccineum]
MTVSELKNKLRTIEKGKNVNTKFDKTETLGKLVCVTLFNKNIANKSKNVSNTKVNADMPKPVTSHPTPKTEQTQKHNENVIARGMYKITKTDTKKSHSSANINVYNSIGVGSSNSVRRPKSKDSKSKNKVLKNTKDKSSSTHIWKASSSVIIDSNKCEAMNSNVCQANKSVLNTKTISAVNDGSNIVYVSCGKDVFLLSHKKCVARYALSRNSNVKRALFTTPVAAKSMNLRTTSVLAKSRLSVANTPKATNKVFSASSLSHDSSQSKTLSNYMKTKLKQVKSGRDGLNTNKVLIGHPKAKLLNQFRVKQRVVIQLVLWIVDSGCSKHMTGNLQLLRNFVEKFIGTVHFGNDHFAANTRYEDYVQGNLTIILSAKTFQTKK